MSARPDDIQPPLLWYREETSGTTVTPDGLTLTSRGFRMTADVNPDRNWPGHRVYWGSHGCCRPADHAGPCWCDCCDCADHPDPDSGCVAGPPYYGPDTNFYGEDAASGVSPEPPAPPADLTSGSEPPKVGP